MKATESRPLTSRTRVALAIARGIAAARGEHDVTAVHAAIGILREGGNPALSALWYAGMSPNVIRNLHVELERALGAAPGKTEPRRVTVDDSPGEQELLRAGENEAVQLNDEFLGTDHILLAILRGDSAVSARFGEHGITAGKYLEGLNASRRGDPPPLH